MRFGIGCGDTDRENNLGGFALETGVLFELEVDLVGGCGVVDRDREDEGGLRLDFELANSFRRGRSIGGSDGCTGGALITGRVDLDVASGGAWPPLIMRTDAEATSAIDFARDFDLAAGVDGTSARSSSSSSTISSTGSLNDCGSEDGGEGGRALELSSFLRRIEAGEGESFALGVSSRIKFAEKRTLFIASFVLGVTCAELGWLLKRSVRGGG